mmetsp:Transcript_6339/g.11446  ORF Transcript_6339/g.11446 Transcript_6339/m.11446 type:complete len:368 (-) Transcript_6339:48-1151(-)
MTAFVALPTLWQPHHVFAVSPVSQSLRSICYQARTRPMAVRKTVRTKTVLKMARDDKKDGKDEELASEEQLRAFELSRRFFLVLLGSWTVWISSKLFYQREMDMFMDSVDAKLAEWGISKRSRDQSQISRVDPKLANALIDAPLLVVSKDLKLMKEDDLLYEESTLRPKSRRFFITSDKNMALPKQEDVTDIRTLNWLVYCRNHVIGEALTSRNDRKKVVRAISRRLLDTILDYNTLPKSTSAKDDTAWWQGVRQILARLQALGYYSEFRLDTQAFEEGLWEEQGKSRFSLIVLGLSTITSTQVLAGESLDDMSPIYVSDILAEYLDRNGVRVDFENYYLDDTFQRSPFNYRPTGVATEFNIDIKKA